MLKFGICGLGQCGNKIANYMVSRQRAIGKETEYICSAINISQKDLDGIKDLNTTHKLKISTAKDTGGAGKNPRIGEMIARQDSDAIMKFLQKLYQNQNIDRLFFAAGLGGGTGTGIVHTALLIALKLGLDVGLILTLPHEKDPVIQSNALSGIAKLGELINHFRLPVYSIDNARAITLLADGKKDLLNINIQFLDDFSLFNEKATRKSIYRTFDEMDHRNMYNHTGGVMAITHINLPGEQFFNNPKTLIAALLHAWENHPFIRVDPSKIIQLTIIMDIPSHHLDNPLERTLCEDIINTISEELMQGKANIFVGLYPVAIAADELKISLLCSGLPLPIERLSALKDAAECGLEAIKKKEEATRASFDLSGFTSSLEFNTVSHAPILKDFALSDHNQAVSTPKDRASDVDAFLKRYNIE